MDKASLTSSPFPIVAGSSSPGMAGLAILCRRSPPKTEVSRPPTTTSPIVVKGEGPNLETRREL
jgi:hypothetical protein